MRTPQAPNSPPLVESTPNAALATYATIARLDVASSLYPTQT
ncbi:hypothetical protein [Helicobacter zhangjianzhongii]|uniref:Uncharacterized protein n=1 Tax=Helicobacter zhangjianzhongii TaxID=2974574 RepID=A0ACC6FSD0_9HELI|nr:MULTISPECIES: hypothetical protein [unclassified Helicobacter]MDL0079718.1 hypothetical protein [Helicobacter sp. CPD2-1]MDL0082188.1 hypothetical protein [Helicobacter sp. XJK30-2]